MGCGGTTQAAKDPIGKAAYGGESAGYLGQARQASLLREAVNPFAEMQKKVQEAQAKVAYPVMPVQSIVVNRFPAQPQPLPPIQNVVLTLSREKARELYDVLGASYLPTSLYKDLGVALGIRN